MRASLLSVALIAACTPTPPPRPTPPRPIAAPSAPAPAPAPPARATKIRTVEGITEYRLDNGLQVLLFPDPSQATVTVNITYLVGSRHEGYGETGMAHLLEHMMFKGSPRHRNVLKLLQERGGQANGTTWLDRTNYYGTLPASRDNLEWAIDLEADRMRHATISPDDLATEFSVVRNEFEAGENDPVRVLDDRIVSTAFLWHNYGKATIGSRSDIEKVPVPALRAFYDKYYQPDNAMLVVAGKFEDGHALATIERLFGAIPHPTRALPATYTVEPVQDGEREVVLRRSGELHVIGIAYHAVSGISPEFPAVECAVDVLTRQPSGRLYKKLVETKLAANVAGSAQATRDPYLAQAFVQVRDPKHVAAVERTLIEEFEKLGSSPIDDRDVARWRTATIKELDLAMADSTQLAIELSEWAAKGDWRTLFAYRAAVGKVTAAEVARVAKAYFKASNRTLGRFVPTKDAERAPLTTTPEVGPIVEGIVGGTVAEQGEAFVATLDNIEARTLRKQLAGGLAAALLPKKTRGGKVELALELHWGTERTLHDKGMVPVLVGAMLERGTTKHTFQELADLEDQLKAKIEISAKVDGLSISISTLRDHLPAAIDLVAEMVTSPSFPDKELAIVRQEQLAALEEQSQDTTETAIDVARQLIAKWPKGDPRYAMTAREKIASIGQLKLADLKQFYKEFVGAGHGEVVVVGDFDAAAIAAQLEQRFGGWQTKQPYARLADRAWRVPGETRVVDLEDKEMTTLVTVHDVAMRDDNPDYPAWLMLSQVLGGDTGSRLWMRLREKEGLSYGVSSFVSAAARDEVGTFGTFAIVAPQNAAKAKAALLEEIGRIVAGPPTEEELRHAKEAWTKDLQTRLADDATVVELLADALEHGRTTEHARQLELKVRAVTAADVARVAKKYIDLSRLIVVVAGDRSKIK